MGNESSSNFPKIAHSPEWTLNSHLRHQLYGDIRVFQSNSDRTKFHAIKSHLFHEHELYTSKLNELTLHSTIKVTYNIIIQIPSLVKIIDIETLVDSKLCSDFYKIIATYEFFPTTLAQEIN
jgi:hypothetical protein